jgi:outer membrane protein assembly factor BamD (BamD/ComL family)
MKNFLFFLIPALIFTACSSKTAEEYLKTAEENVKNNNITEAVQQYEALVNEFPGNENSAEALYQLAVLHHNKMVPEIPSTLSMEKASDYYKRLQEKFPSDSRAPMALFMSAYIKANELKNYPEATELYNKFISKYPKHDLASSASQELEIMGLSPDEVLKKKTAAVSDGLN